MPELYTLQVSNVAAEVKAQFGEEGDVQVTDAHVIRWVNRGQREIAVRTQFLKARADINLVAGTPTYDLGAQRLLKIDSVYVNGTPVQLIPVEVANRDVRYIDPQATARATAPEVAWLDDGVLNMYPAPSLSVTNGLRVHYLKYPVDVTAVGDTLGIPDRLFNQLVQFCLAQAQYLDGNHEQHADDMAGFEEGLARQANLQNAPEASAYPQVQPDPDDMVYATGDGYFL